jgi:hypothetical protein
VKCERKGCRNETGRILVTPSRWSEKLQGGFVVVEARTKEGHVVTMPFEWRCELHAPGNKDCPDYGETFQARFTEEYVKRFRYEPPVFVYVEEPVSMVAVVSHYAPDFVAKLRHQWELAGHADVKIETSLPVDVVLIDPDVRRWEGRRSD